MKIIRVITSERVYRALEGFSKTILLDARSRTTSHEELVVHLERLFLW